MNDAGNIFVNIFLKVFLQKAFSGMNGKNDMDVDLAVGICHIYFYRSLLAELTLSVLARGYKQFAPSGASGI